MEIKNIATLSILVIQKAIELEFSHSILDEINENFLVHAVFSPKALLRNFPKSLFLNLKFRPKNFPDSAEIFPSQDPSMYQAY